MNRKVSLASNRFSLEKARTGRGTIDTMKQASGLFRFLKLSSLMKRVAFLLLSLLLVFAPAGAFELPADSKQCLVGIASGWNSSYVTLTLYERGMGGWKPSGSSWKGRLGKNGLVWGKGLHPVPSGVTTKKEGDRRAPAGVFDLGGAWGYASSIKKSPNLSYVQVTQGCL
ncbi:MAG: hypothetical protein AAF357_10255, partial [Verrucomicrobiota bacterium]